jgi:maleylpyruvate isomerase
MAIKNLAYEYVAVDLRAGEQSSEKFRSVNPQGLVPALIVDDQVLTQSSAIIEWLEERFPSPSLLPQDPWDRAIVRSMAATISSDIQPLNNMRVQAHLREQLDAADEYIERWVHRWIREGFDALEMQLQRHAGSFGFGDRPTLVDVYLVPQAGMAERLGFDLAPYPRLLEVVQNAGQHAAFLAAQPAAQPDWN